MVRSAWLAAASMVAMTGGWSQAAVAQVAADPAANEAPVPAVQAEAPDAAVAPDGGALGDIVVTAQRRTASLQDTPVAVTVADAAVLAEARVENIANISAISPSITFRATNNAASSGSIQIRGVGTSGNSRSFEGAVGVFVDGVYRTRSGQALQNFLDVENLQILRGPQGTLFGKNTTAGAVLITSNAPTLGETTGALQFDYGNFDTVIGRAAVSTPLGENAAIRVAGLYRRNDGFYRDPNDGRDYNGDETWAAKAQLLFEPTDALRVRLIGDYSKSVGNCCYGTVDIPNAGPTQAIIDSLIRARGLTPPSRIKERYEAVLSSDGRQRVEDYGGTMLIDLDVGPGKLSSITALRNYVLRQDGVDAEFTGADILTLDETFSSRFFSQELTYSGKLTGGLNADYVFGAFFSDEDITARRALTWGTQAQAYWDIILAGRGLPAGTSQAPAGLRTREVMKGGGQSFAAFTNWDVKLGDRFNVIAGARYTYEKKNGSLDIPFYTPLARDPLRLLGSGPGPNYAATNNRGALSGTLGLQYRPSREAMFYATYNRGFKAGGVNMDASAAGGRANNANEVPGGQPLDPRFQPETVNAYEIGAKFDLFDRRVRLNLAAFHSDIKNLQVAQFLGIQFQILNARSAKVTGLEGEATVKIGRALTLNAAGTWLPEASYGIDPTLNQPLPGRRFATTPKFAGNLGLNLDTPINDRLSLVGRVQGQYSGRHFTNTQSNAIQPAYGLLNLNAGVQSADGWRLEAFVTNFTNEVIYARHFQSPLQTGDQNAYLGAPRQYGISARFNF